MKLSMVALLLASSVGIAFAQATTPVVTDTLDPWLKAGVAAVSLACLVWVVQHLLRHTIPQQQDTFKETLDKIGERSERHDEAFRQTLADHTSSCREIQQRYSDEQRQRRTNA